MRLDKFIAHTTDFSRKQIQQLVKRLRVTVNGILENNAARILQPNDKVMLDKEWLQEKAPRYFMLHKPAGVVCANTDAHYPTVIDLLDIPHKHQLQIAGRLDADTTGLVLLTDDGQWNHRVTSPRRNCAKRYRVNTAEPIVDDVIRHFQKGVQLRGEKTPTQPARLEILDAHTAILEIYEGRYHQVKRMFAATGNRVTALHREAIGDIWLDNHLNEGQFRALSPQEILSI